jgi:hypothetical protein
VDHEVPFKAGNAWRERAGAQARAAPTNPTAGSEISDRAKNPKKNKKEKNPKK